MIRSIVRNAAQLTGKEEVIVLPVFEGETKLTGMAKKLDILCRSAVSKTIDAKHFEPKRGSTAFISVQQAKAPDYVLLVGMGKRKKLDAETAAIAGGAASRVLKAKKFATAHFLLQDALEDSHFAGLLDSFLKGVLLAQYSFAIKAAAPKSTGVRKVVVMSDDRSIGAAITRARVVADHAAVVRDLVNEPANTMTPKKIAEEARTLCKETGVECKVLGKRDIERMGMGAVMAVAQGSAEDPQFIVMHYNKGAADRDNVTRVALVGKGVSFDTGGISIKPWMNMNEMKGDMGGAAVVISSIAAAARLKLPVEIIALVPCVENMPSGTAFRPGDVITTYAGKTIEIISTDAEGRLILSDALTYSLEFEPDVIVDYATLTGAVVIALGTRIAGVMGNDDEYIAEIIAAGKEVGEPVWELPLDEVFSEGVRGDISDYKNYSGRDGSTITAAALLGEFVGDTPWMHVDIAGTFWSEGGRVPYHTKGATGYGVDLTLRLLERIASGD